MKETHQTNSDILSSTVLGINRQPSNKQRSANSTAPTESSPCPPSLNTAFQKNMHMEQIKNSTDSGSTVLV